MYITMCLYITITILLWVLSIYRFIKHYTIVILYNSQYIYIGSVCSSVIIWCSALL